MQQFRFDPGDARQITAHGSRGLALSPIVRTDEPCQAVVMHVAAGGEIGFHPAGVPQLFLVVQGSGWVCGADRERVAVDEGSGTFWASGESHGAGSDDGMTAAVFESEGLDPGIWPAGSPGG